MVKREDHELCVVRESLMRAVNGVALTTKMLDPVCLTRFLTRESYGDSDQIDGDTAASVQWLSSAAGCSRAGFDDFIHTDLG
jgi:hypothetical protein